MLQASSMVEVQMTHYDHLDVFDVVPSKLYLFLKLLLRSILDLGKDVVQRRAPDSWIIFSCPRFVQDKAFDGMFDQSCGQRQLASLVWRIGV